MLLVVAMQPVACAALVPAAGDDSLPYAATIVTPDGRDIYTFDSIGDTMVVEAPAANRDSNLRALFWPADGRSVTNGETCARWASRTGSGLSQVGAALRVRTDRGGDVQAVTVTQNVYAYGTWIFNFHVWDTGKEPEFTPIGSVTLEDTLFPGGLFIDWPWEICARTVGAKLEFKVWPSSDAEPAWGDRRHGGSVTLGDRWVYAGKSGWYVGHLGPGDVVRLTELTT